jgi:hypothetical protein
MEKAHQGEYLGLRVRKWQKMERTAQWRLHDTYSSQNNRFMK